MFNFSKKEKGIPVKQKEPAPKTHVIIGEDLTLELELWRTSVLDGTYYGWRVEGSFKQSSTENERTTFRFMQRDCLASNVNYCYDSMVGFFERAKMLSISEVLKVEKQRIMEEAWKRSLD